MRARQEIAKLQKKLAEGSLHPDEPLFVLRGRDKLAAGIVRQWVCEAEAEHNPGVPEDKIAEADALADLMDQWPVKQTPGRPETRLERKHRRPE